MTTTIRTSKTTRTNETSRTKQKSNNLFRPLNVAVARGSRAEKVYLARGGLPGSRPGGRNREEEQTKDIAPGVKPTPRHNLIFHGGKTIHNLTFANFYVGGMQSWKASDTQQIDKALAAAMSDKDLNNMMMQYFGDKPITSIFKSSHILPGSKPKVFSQGDVEQMVKQLHTTGLLKDFDLASTVCNFMLPSGTVLTTDEAPTMASKETAKAAEHNPIHPEDEVSSLEGLGGYHGSVHVSPQVTVYYAVGVYSERLPNGTANGIVAFDQPWKNIVATFYHELNEARTDADVEDAIQAGNDPNAVKLLGWVSRQGEECGDFPMSEVGFRLSLVMQEVVLTNGDGKVPVQFQYSNAVMGPEGPIPSPHPLHTRV